MKFILGKKVGMSRVFRGKEAVPVTLLLVEPCHVSQVKEIDKDGYQAVQVSCGEKKKITKPLVGHLKKAKLKSAKHLVEFRMEDASEYKPGQEIKVSIFQPGDNVRISAVSKGKGFTGVVKRHGFAGSPKTHGHRHDERAPGSIGAGFPQHVMKGMKMAGRSGYGRISVKNLEVIEVDTKKNILAISGTVPGPRNGLVEIISTSAAVEQTDKDKSEKK